MVRLLFVLGVLASGADGGDPAKSPAKPSDPDQGRKHWAFRPLARVDPPPVRDADWCRTPLDRFILAALEDRGLAPNPPADRRVLIRRAYLDLLGLPPPPEEVEAFARDGSEDAWAALIDRLLASPRYGERWGRYWLDLARFAESHGFEHDYDRPTAYHYRDFVIRALNQDLPYDRFVRWQIAGDEIEPENPLALMATGFLAAGVHSTQITKNQVEKERYDELDDMAATVGTAMLGLTVGCARCHDHKFDPIPVADYYRFVSNFTTAVRSEVELNLSAEEHAKLLETHRREHAPLAARLERFEREELPGRLRKWLADRPPAGDRAPWLVVELTGRSAGGADLRRLPDGSLLASGKNPEHETYTLTARTGLTGITAVRLEALADPSLVKGGPGRASNGNFALSEITAAAVRADGQGAPVPLKLVRPRATFEQKGLPAAAAVDGKSQTAWAVDPQFGKDHAVVFDLETPAGFEDGAVITFTLKFEVNTGHSIARPRLSVSTLAATASLPLQGGSEPQNASEIAALLEKSRAAGRPADESRLLDWYRRLDPRWQELEREVEEHAARAPRPELTKVLITTEGLPALRLHTQGDDFFKETHFLKRGDPAQKLGIAPPGYLGVLTRAGETDDRWRRPPPQGWRTSWRRRALAEWITDVDGGAGGLLARVMVNRLWQHHLGRGIVATPSDFGTQGKPPTHPELLDWLAGRLIGSGWSLKEMHRLILTSAVYLQSAAADERKAAVDPEDRLWGRWRPRRLEAEAIRDSLLAAGGDLEDRMFGSGSLDPNQRRRSIYFTVKRSQLIPMLVLFDGPDANTGLGERATTTIAPQALLLLNSPLVRRSAEGFARGIDPGPDGSGVAAVESAYLVALARRPSLEELAVGERFLVEETASYRSEGKSNARELALADFCQTLLCLNEFIYLE